MDRVAATIKVYPKDVDVDLEKLRESIRKALPEDASVFKFEEEPIAFGLVALICHIVMPETGGGVDALEDRLRKLESVGELQTVMVRRV